MMHAPEVRRSPLATVQVRPGALMPDRQRVREILDRVAAEVLSEVEAGTWSPPATLARTGRRSGSATESSRARPNRR